MMYIIVGVIAISAFIACWLGEKYEDSRSCSHLWVENHQHPMFHATRVCSICGKIEIKAVKLAWCDNYANIAPEEATEIEKERKFQV